MTKAFLKQAFVLFVANEFDSKICPTFKANFPDTHLIEGDIRNVKESEFPEHVAGIIGGLHANLGVKQAVLRGLKMPEDSCSMNIFEC